MIFCLQTLKSWQIFFRRSERIDDLKTLYVDFGKSIKGRKYFKDIFLDLYWEAFVAGNDERQEIGLELLQSESLSMDKDVIHVVRFHNLVKELGGRETPKYLLYDSGEKFDEKVFNQKVEEQVAKLDEFKKKNRKGYGFRASSDLSFTGIKCCMKNSWHWGTLF